MQRGCRKQEIYSTRWNGNVTSRDHSHTVAVVALVYSGGGDSTEITIKNDRHVTVIFFLISYILLYCLLLPAQHCCHLVFVKVE